MNNKWLQEEGLHDFIRKDHHKYVCFRASFDNGEDLFQHAVDAHNKHKSLLHLGIMHYMSLLYEDEIKTPKKPKKVSVHDYLHLDITNCYTFCIKR